MKTKKFLSLVMAFVMILSLSVVAFAESGPAYSDKLQQSTTVTGTTEVPTIKVVVPTTAKIIVNPYQMTVTTVEDDPATSDADESETSDVQIISAPVFISSASNIALKVSATVTGKVGGKAKFATASTIVASGSTASTNKDVYLYFQMALADDGDTAPDWATFNDTNGVVVGTKAATIKDVVTLADGSTTPTFAAFHFGGDVVSAPAEAWTATDTVSATVAFSFAPVSN